MGQLSLRRTERNYIGYFNDSASSTYTGWIDLFGFGTSGYNIDPYLCSTTTLYGICISGTNYDWGFYNAISNGGNTPRMWRVLKISEWDYIIDTRTTVSGIRYAKATINDVAGLIIVPDNWDASTYTLNSTNTKNAAYTTKVISSANWGTLENAGCVFLPAAGYRYGFWIRELNTTGKYLTSPAGTFSIYKSSISNSASSSQTDYGYSVRLVTDN